MPIKVYFATTRCPNNRRRPTAFGETICADDPQNIRFGVAQVSDDLEKVSFTVAPEANVGRKNEKLGSVAVFDEVRRDLLAEPADCMFFVHGFANTFESALIRAAQLKQFYGAGGSVGKQLHMFAFCWPSDGVVVSLKNAYRSDRMDAQISGPAIGRTILKAIDFIGRLAPDERCNRRIHLLAHSMGNWALRHALTHIQVLGAAPACVFDQAILAAPDEDADAFESEGKLGYLPRLARRVSVYTNYQDSALHVSDWAKGNPDRLGKGGPSNPDRVARNVTVVNCSKVITDKGDMDLTSHQYYRNDETVRRDIVAVLKGATDDMIDNRRWVLEKRYYTLDAIAGAPALGRAA